MIIQTTRLHAQALGCSTLSGHEQMVRPLCFYIRAHYSIGRIQQVVLSHTILRSAWLNNQQVQ